MKKEPHIFDLIKFARVRAFGAPVAFAREVEAAEDKASSVDFVT